MKNTVTITIEEYDELRRIRDEIYKGNVLEIKARYSNWDWNNPPIKYESYCDFEIAPKSRIDQFVLTEIEDLKKEIEVHRNDAIKLTRLIQCTEILLKQINILNFNKKANTILKKIKEL